MEAKRIRPEMETNKDPTQQEQEHRTGSARGWTKAAGSAQVIIIRARKTVQNCANSARRQYLRAQNAARGNCCRARARVIKRCCRSHSQRRFPVRPSSDYEDDTIDSVVEETPRAPEPPPRDPARIAAITGSTPLPQFFTTTVRPSRAISSSGLLSGRNLRTSTTTTTTTAPAFVEPRETEEPAGPKTIQPFVK